MDESRVRITDISLAYGRNTARMMTLLLTFFQLPSSFKLIRQKMVRVRESCSETNTAVGGSSEEDIKRWHDMTSHDMHQNYHFHILRNAKKIWDEAIIDQKRKDMAGPKNRWCKQSTNAQMHRYRHTFPVSWSSCFICLCLLGRRVKRSQPCSNTNRFPCILYSRVPYDNQMLLSETPTCKVDLLYTLTQNAPVLHVSDIWLQVTEIGRVKCVWINNRYNRIYVEPCAFL
jgi:hypothetical protein